MQTLLRLIATLILTTLPAMAEVLSTPGAGQIPQPGSAAWFGIHLIDTSTEGAINGARADETARIAATNAYIAQNLTERGFQIREPDAALLAGIKNPARSNGRDSAIARDMGVDYAITAEVQKVSNLILALNLHLRDARTGHILRSGSVDIRSNTDDSWQRGFRYLLKNIIFREEQPR
ncbi:MAG: DUF3280 domain-containing protein [Paracoccus sp. (in: a-proteobacteria)]|uniref:DUF3280 domain-containing protein n=1 Tax=Paracoccus sp. TaxID=267 RepID=UPI0026E0B609|nr:DUF3280 domain-containing protein [Paracoccus sp. (in: a-proteobacteria)]MDO5631883.1 DUF3280 domain-containing protein [Paracoccus sp. (in: a-proteobacteria)]